jgi:hypothetical protein
MPSPSTPPSSSECSSESWSPEADAEHRPLLGNAPPQHLVEPLLRSSAIAEPAEPTPGSTARSAPSTSSTSSAPSRRRAISTERMFPAR